MCMYSRNAKLLHLPIEGITECSIPALAAIVVAPILKLYAAKFSSGDQVI